MARCSLFELNETREGARGKRAREFSSEDFPRKISS